LKVFLKSILILNAINIRSFQKFKIESGNVVWGEKWDLIFPVSQLYKGKISF
jgi:hypothetical protein